MSNSDTSELGAPVQPGRNPALNVSCQKDADEETDENNVETGQEENPVCNINFVGLCNLKRLLAPQRNKLSLYTFGSEGAIEKECDRQKQTGQWVIHPLSPVRHYYVVFMVLLTFVSLISVPLEMAFTEEAFSSISNYWLGFNLSSDILFIIDVILNFRTGILTEDSEVAILDLKTIRNEYLKTWFIPDILSAFSFDLVIALVDVFNTSSNKTSIGAGKIMRLFMLARLLSLIRLLRVSKLVRFFRDMERDWDKNLQIFVRIIFLFILMFLLCHWNGCIQYVIPMLQGFPSDCWIVKENLLNATFPEKYFFSMFRAVSHMVRISYGSNFPPTDELDMCVVMISMLSGAIMYMMLFSNVLAVMTNVELTEKLYKRKMRHLEDYMTYRRLPGALRARIRDYYQARYEGKWVNEKNALSLVSKSLKEEVLTVTCAHFLKNVPMFQNCDISFISAVLSKLQHEVFQEGDIIVHKNVHGDCMFFIEHGQVNVETESFQKELRDGDYFGEVALLTRGKQAPSVRAQSTCHLLSLSADDFDQILQEFPVEKTVMESLAQQCCEDFNKAEQKHSVSSTDAEPET